MSEKRFRVRFEQEDGKGEIVNKDGVELTAREVVYKLNEQQTTTNKLQEENEQLRKTINEVIELLLEEVDLFSDKATEHDIIAYKEMNEFDNKDAYYMCISTKKAIQMLQRCVSDE